MYFSKKNSKIKNVEVCQVVDQAKIALSLVQNWICKNEVTKLKNVHKNFKIHHAK